MKIIVADSLPASALEVLKTDGWIVDSRTGRSPKELIVDLADTDAILVRSATKIDASLIAAAPKLRIIARAGVGVDNVDVDAASARGILVVNAAGASSISVAEHAWALLLALSRNVPAADRAMKAGKWEKKNLLGVEVRGKTLGVAGFGRIGQEVAQRARAFGMHVITHDPFISAELAARSGVQLVSLDELCATADYLTLHLPATKDTRHLFDDARFAKCKPGIRLINTARGELVEEGALKRAIESGIVAGAALDVFETEPPADWSLAQLPQVVATPHIAASTEEAQELVGLETAVTVRNFLRDGVVRNAVNFPSIMPEEMQRLQPWIRLADHLGALAAQMGVARVEAINVRYYGALAEGQATDILASSAATGVLRPMLHDRDVSIVNARTIARSRGIDVAESRSARARHLTSLMGLKLHTSDGERWVEGTVFEPDIPRLVSVAGISVDAPLSGTLLVIANDDQPGVIGEVGTILGRLGVNIASFALGRGDGGAIGVVNVDAEKSAPEALDSAIEAILKAPHVRDAWVVRL
ncbi:MAG TPA: phosphoglycerate dehydrogenase [Vicinamibacterales bacterium]|nr:phosphoglycerate dehydrogenase [Vicinamibacterales bacterium]